MILSTWQKRIFLVLFAILLPLTIAETLLRSIQYGSMAFWQPDSVYGKALITNGEGWYTNEGRAFVRINNQGYHDQNHQIEKPENVFRIAVLGDSFVEAIQLPYQKSFWYLLSNKLQTCPALLGKTIESFGFGVSNYGTGHQLLMLQQDVLEYQPDEVVLSFYQGNDITDNSSFYYSGPSPSFTVENDELIIGNEFSQNAEFKKRIWLVKLGYYRIILKFRVFELIRNSIKLIPRFFKHPSQSRIDRTDGGLIDSVLQEKYVQEYQKAWVLTQDLIKQFASETKNANSGFTFLSIPHSNLLVPAAVEETNEVSAQRLQTFRATNKKLSEFTQTNKIDGVNLSKELRAFSKDNDSHLYGFENNRLGYGHFSGYGHEKTADVLAQHICLKLSKS